MKVTFKDLKQQKFSLDGVEPTDLISTVKQRISEEKGWDPKSQKLIYSGKILKDEDTVEHYQIEEKGFVVCMVQKSKPAAAAAAPTAPATASTSSSVPETPARSTAATPAAPPAPSQPSGNPSPAPATPSPAPAAGGQGAGGDGSMALGAEREGAIANMVAMGFERATAEAALRAAFFNPDRAVEYCLTGIPESARQSQQQAAPQSPTGAPAAAAAAAGQPAGGDAEAEGGSVNLFDLAAQQGRGGSRGSSGGAAAAAAAAVAGEGAGAGLAGGRDLGNLDWLRNNAQFQQLRQVVQQQPQMLEPILQQLGAGNPQLAQLIAQNPDQFLNLLGEDGDDDAPLPPGARAISVTEEERDAIERLCRLGFDRDAAIQAYFACDKNEELAANFLFDQPEDDEPPQN
ncbi:XPC-binding domain-containing protein [Xylariomycetidae sp. FL2044]|nr:XPC-binding domain-containing protein [Xylariomycetidae sp. FL2044]